MEQKLITAAVMVIGDEILSGRTKDTNSNTIALFLAPFGIQLREIRVVGDDENIIIETLNHLRNNYNYVFTTGGIGPTHDDITADCIAKAFGVGIKVRDDAVQMMLNRYKPEELTEARLRMARIPDGASLVKNPVSYAPGFQMDNVFTMAGVPNIMRAMLDDIAPRLETGRIVISKTIKADNLKEGDIALPLGEIAKNFPDLSFGSYPWFKGDGFGAQLVVRGFDDYMVNQGKEQIFQMLINLGLNPYLE
jgi:molybdenum cofactor synthesis domain-containing protein